MQYVFFPEWSIILTLYLPFLIIPIFFAAYVPNWKKAVQLKEERGWQVSGMLFSDTSNTRGNLSSIPWGWYIVCAIIIFATFIAAIIQFPSLPDMIAGHLDASIQPTRYVEKTWGSVLMMPIMNAATFAVMILTAIAIEKAKLQIDPTHPKLSFAQHQIYRRRMGHSIGFMTFGIVVLIAILGLPFIFPDSSLWGIHIFAICMVLFIAPLVVLTAVMLKTGQGGCNVKLDITEKEIKKSPSIGRGDDKFWIWGMFYYNPEDPAIIVENRFGTNLGVNYARLPVKIVLAIFTLAIIVMYVWSTAVLF
jgi:uncharacterized membrane protein